MITGVWFAGSFQHDFFVLLWCVFGYICCGVFVVGVSVLFVIE